MRKLTIRKFKSKKIIKLQNIFKKMFFTIIIFKFNIFLQIMLFNILFVKIKLTNKKKIIVNKIKLKKT